MIILKFPAHFISFIPFLSTSIVCWALLMSLTGTGLAQTQTQTNSLKDSASVVYAVMIEGNQVTSEKFIRREMMLKPGVLITKKLIEKDKLRLMSLGLFNRVEIRTASDKGRAVVYVTVTEPWYLYFFPRANYELSNPDNLTWGGGVYHHNLFGSGERITAMGWTGYDKALFLSYEDPWFGISGKLSVSVHIKFDDTDIEGPDEVIYREEISEYGFSIRRRLSKTSWIGGELTCEQRSSLGDFYTYSDSNRDRLLVGKLLFELDQRDYRYYPTKGYLIRSSLDANRIVNENHEFLRERIDMRRYVTVGDIILAWRIWGEFSQKSLPWYRRSSLSHDLIRADHDFGDGGWMSMASNFEVRFNLLEKRYFSLEYIKYAGRYLRNMQFSIEGVLFADTGYTRYNSDNKVVRTDLSAWGGGFQFQLPYIETAYVLMGWSPKDNLMSKIFIAGTGVTF